MMRVQVAPRIKLPLATALWALSLAAASATPAPSLDERRAAGRIAAGMTSVPTSIDPAKAWNTHQYLLIGAVYQTLIRISESGRLVGDLAVRWEISPDGKTYLFELNSNARFHDGRPVTAECVAWSLSRHFWPGHDSIAKAILGQALGPAKLPEGDILPQVRVIGPNRLELKLPRPYPPLPHVMAMPAFAILPRETPSDTDPIGSGPMTARRDPASDHWTLKVYSEYSGSKPATQAITFEKVTGTSDALAKLEAGRLDAVWGLHLAEVTSSTLPERTRVIPIDGLTYLHLFFNAERGILADRALRQDLGHLLQGVLWRGPKSPFLKEQATFLPRGILPPSYHLRPPVPMSAERFSQRHALGASPTLRVVIRAVWFSPTMADAIEHALNRAGFTAIVKRVDSAGYLEALKSGDYDIVSGGYMGSFPDPDGFLEPLTEESPLRLGRFPSRRLMRELESFRSIREPRMRLGKYADALRVFEEEMFLVPLFHMSLPLVADRRLSVPDSSFRYEGEIWKIFWRE